MRFPMGSYVEPSANRKWMLCLSTNAVIKINIYVLQEAENGMDIHVHPQTQMWVSKKIVFVLFKVTEVWLQTSHSSREAENSMFFMTGDPLKVGTEIQGVLVLKLRQGQIISNLFQSPRYPHFPCLQWWKRSWEPQGPRSCLPLGTLKPSPPHLWGTTLSSFCASLLPQT